MEATKWEEITVNIIALIEKRMSVFMEQKRVSAKAQDPKMQDTTFQVLFNIH